MPQEPLCTQSGWRARHELPLCRLQAFLHPRGPRHARHERLDSQRPSSGLGDAEGGLMAKRPNIILLQTDQQRWDAVGYVNPMVKTPHLDALAKQGIRFEQAVCQAPMCLPSRHAMMTGLYPSQSGSRNNT